MQLAWYPYSDSHRRGAFDAPWISERALLNLHDDYSPVGAPMN